MSVHAAHRLGRVVLALEAGRAVERDDATNLAAGLRRLLAGECEADEALGLRVGRGERTWRSESRRAQRNAAVVAASGQFFGGSTEQTAVAFGRYRASGWVRERVLDECPAHRSGKPEALFWTALKALDADLSAKTIGRMFADTR